MRELTTAQKKYKVVEKQSGRYVYEMKGYQYMMIRRNVPFVNKYGFTKVSWALFEIDMREKAGEVLQSAHIATRRVKSELFEPY